MLGFRPLLALLAALTACSQGSGPRGPEAGAGRELTLFLIGDLRGTIEPCGCTTDPLGDLARTTRAIAEARATGRPVAVLDAGGMLFSAPELTPEIEPQELLKADLLVDAYAKQLAVAAVGLGAHDLAKGAAAVRPVRQAANVAADAGVPLEAPRVIDVGGVSVGVFGVVAPAAVAPAGVAASDPVPAAAAAVKSLRERGAQVVVALAGMPAKDAKSLAREVPGIDLVVVGARLEEPELAPRRAEEVGGAWVIAGANRGQIISRVDLTWRGGDKALVDAGGEANARTRIAAIDLEIPALEAQLADWEQDTTADPAFVARKREELVALRAEREQLQAKPLRAPAAGSYFTLEQLAIKKQLPCDAAVQAAKTAFDAAAGEANVRAAAGRGPVPPAPGAASYVGAEECGYCHAEAEDFWKTTRHTQAWDTLEVAGKQFNYECIRCHTTGFDQPGGATMGVNEHLRDIQCETCHGPGSLHVEADGKEAPSTMMRDAPEKLCLGCHTEDHSDTFDYTAYLRDVTGEGHGAKRRAALGDGPTGRELRAAGLAKAGAGIGEGCKK